MTSIQWDRVIHEQPSRRPDPTNPLPVIGVIESSREYANELRRKAELTEMLADHFTHRTPRLEDRT